MHFKSALPGFDRRPHTARGFRAEFEIPLNHKRLCSFPDDSPRTHYIKIVSSFAAHKPFNILLELKIKEILLLARKLTDHNYQNDRRQRQ